MWKPEWNKYDTGRVLYNAHENKKYLISKSEYNVIKDLWNEFKRRDEIEIPEDKLDMLKSCYHKGIFSCISSPLPYPCFLDGACNNFGVKTLEMSKQEPKIGMLAAGYMNIDESTVSGQNIDVTGMTWDRPLEKGEIWVDSTGDGLALPTTNSKTFENLSMTLLISVAVIFVICIIGIIVASQSSAAITAVAELPMQSIM